jgi:choline dehydrogenase-like flavoprotein
MKYLDFNEQIESDFFKSFDLVVVGAGAVGFYLGSKYENKNVLIIESGSFNESQQLQCLNKVSNKGKVLSSAEWGRKRAIGGTTIAWGGQSLPFCAVDFVKKEYLTNSPKWPLSADDLKMHYDRVNSWMNVDGYDYRQEVFEKANYKPLEFNKRKVDCHFSKWAPKPNFNDIIRKKETNQCFVFYNATVARLSLEENHIVGLTLKNGNKVQDFLLACPVVLANHTIESVRLLLILNQEYLFLPAEKAELLGRGFGEHPCMYIGYIETKQPYFVQRKLNTQISKGRKYGVRMSISPEFMLQHQLLNISASIMNRYSEDYDPYQELRNFVKMFKIGSVLKLRNLVSYVTSAWAYMKNAFVYKHKSRIDVQVMCEQEWLMDSTLKLSDMDDVLGMRMVEVDWRISDKTPKTIIEFAGVLAEEFERLGLGDLILDNSIIERDSSAIVSKLTDVNHQMGGAVFGDDPRRSILNSNLKVHEIENLFVASAACFPSFSHSNPTLTLLALADRMKIEFR